MIKQTLDKIFLEVPYAKANAESLFSKKRLISFFLSIIQITLLLLIMRELNIENQSGISKIFYLVLISFAVISFIPLRYRPFLFFITFVGVVYFVFGFFTCIAIVFGGGGVIALCHLPIKFKYRVMLLVLFAFGLSFFVLKVYKFHVVLIAQLLAAMFMFRIILYMYEVKFNSIKSTFWQKISYFFIFPNICFLFFPIIDYKEYVKKYYDINDELLWQKGIRWMLRGIMHYIAYRFVYYYVCIPIEDVHNLLQLLQHICSSFALVLRISGLFHFIIGLLCIYGYNLSAPFDNYFLATGFVDLWRRINIYWREFMLKIFFYPLVMRLKKITQYAIPLSTWLMFVITFIFHAYQLFWIKGNVYFKASDIIFWITIGTFITIDVIVTEKNISKPKKKTNLYMSHLYTILKIIAMFLFMSFMWSFWTNESISEWIFLMKKLVIFSNTQIAILLTIFLAIVCLGFLIKVLVSAERIQKIINIPPQSTLFLTMPSVLILSVLLIKRTKHLFPEKIQTIIQTVSSDKYNEDDKRKVDAGYYKEMIDGDDTRAATNSLEMMLLRYKNRIVSKDIFQPKTTIMLRELKPNTKEKMSEGFTIETNSFGMRDKEYTLTKPDSIYRMALLGGSYEMGSGVDNDAIFEKLIEDELNEKERNGVIKKYEILNFGVSGTHLVQHVESCNTDRVFKFKPDAVIYVAPSNEGWHSCKSFYELVSRGIDLKYTFLETIKIQSGIEQYMSEAQKKEKLIPYQYSLIVWGYQQIAEACKAHHAKPVWVYLPCTNDAVNPNEYKMLQHIAADLGFITINLSDVYKNYSLKEIVVSKSNTHPSVLGHKLIANKLYKELLKNKKQIFDIH